VVNHGQRFLRGVNLASRNAKTLEGLRRRHFVNEVPVNVEQACAIGLLVNQVIVPDLVVQGRRFGHVRVSLFVVLTALSNRRLFQRAFYSHWNAWESILAI